VRDQLGRRIGLARAKNLTAEEQSAGAKEGRASPLGSEASDLVPMCVYCKEAPDCEHERNSCALSQGERCTERGHDSRAFLPVPPGRGRFTWPPRGEWPKRKPPTKAILIRSAPAKKRTKE
jgi:hypothetical protein